MYRIAVVDDNPTWCFVLSRGLSQCGYEVTSFDGAYPFLKQAQEFDVALIDFSLPARRYQKNLDGPELIHLVRKKLTYPPKLVLLSAYFTEDILSSQELCPEADAVWSKNIGLEEICDRLEQLLVPTQPRMKVLSEPSQR